LGINNQPVGYFLGHISGITSVSSKEDNFLIASNSKDQTMKVWDLRNMESSSDNKNRKLIRYDYRYQSF